MWSWRVLLDTQQINKLNVDKHIFDELTKMKDNNKPLQISLRKICKNLLQNKCAVFEFIKWICWYVQKYMRCIRMTVRNLHGYVSSVIFDVTFKLIIGIQSNRNKFFFRILPKTIKMRFLSSTSFLPFSIVPENEIEYKRISVCKSTLLVTFET